ncbi:hypothetical protein [Xanthomonas albilineans]|uniref:hypothetical protein n=1 Tax=Xanthomonas albilineans TaxID=29447 RepID=UPI0011B016F5|nr:hypothetical protein [Xanthomonas albilineans]
MEAAARRSDARHDHRIHFITVAPEIFGLFLNISAALDFPRQNPFACEKSQILFWKLHLHCGQFHEHLTKMNPTIPPLHRRKIIMAITDLKLCRFRKTALCAMFALAIGATTSAHAGFNDVAIFVKNSNYSAKAILLTNGTDGSTVCSGIVTPTYQGGYANGPDVNSDTWYSVVAMSTPNCLKGTGMSGMFNLFKMGHPSDPQDVRELEIDVNAANITFKVLE